MAHLLLLILAAVLILLSALRVPTFPVVPVHWGWLGLFFALLSQFVP